MKPSNLSDLHKVLNRSASLIEGVQVPDRPEFDAKQCLFDIKFSQVNEEISEKSREPCLTPRGFNGSDGRSFWSSNNNKYVGPGQSSQYRSASDSRGKIIEFFSPVYLATLVLK